MQFQKLFASKQTNFLGIALIIFCLVSALKAQNPTTIWAKTFGGSSTDYPYSVVVTKDNKYVTAGATNSFDGDVDTINRHLLSDGWLLKLDEDGSIIWKKNYGGSGSDGFYSLAKTIDNGFILVGGTSSVDGDLKNTSGRHG